MIGDSKFQEYPNHEEYIKEYFGGLYVPPLKGRLETEKYSGLMDLAGRCTRDTAPLIQGYHFNNETAMRCFIRAVMYDILNNIIRPLPYIDCYTLVTEFFQDNAILTEYTIPTVLFIFYGLHELNHAYNFDLTNKLSEMRKQKDKRTFILSLQSEEKIKSRQEQYNRFNPQKQKAIRKFCVPLNSINEISIRDIKGITRQWEGDSIIQPIICLMSISDIDEDTKAVLCSDFESLPGIPWEDVFGIG